MSHPPAVATGRRWIEGLRIREMWVSLAITAMWVAVVVVAILGPDMTVTNGSAAGDGSSTTIPSGVVVALFAFLGSWVVARYGFRRDRDDAH